jgi:hypothetical protein
MLQKGSDPFFLPERLDPLRQIGSAAVDARFYRAFRDAELLRDFLV